MLPRCRCRCLLLFWFCFTFHGCNVLWPLFFILPFFCLLFVRINPVSLKDVAWKTGKVYAVNPEPMIEMKSFALYLTILISSSFSLSLSLLLSNSNIYLTSLLSINQSSTYLIHTQQTRASQLYAELPFMYMRFFLITKQYHGNWLQIKFMYVYNFVN